MIAFSIGLIVTALAGVCLFSLKKMGPPSGDGTIGMVFLIAGVWVFIIGSLILGSLLSILQPILGWIVAPVVVGGAIYIYINRY